jgi:hypothetical protein
MFPRLPRQVNQILVCLLLFSSPIASEAAKLPIKVEAVLVTTNKVEKPCLSNFYTMIFDLSLGKSEGDARIKQSCQILTLINQKIKGTKQLQISINGSWQDVASSDNWIKPLSSARTISGILTKVSKIQDWNYGKVSSSSSYSLLGKSSCNGCSDFEVPLPLADPWPPQYGSTVYNTKITEALLRVKIVSQGKSYYSNPVTIIYKNLNYYTWIKGADGWGKPIASSEVSATPTSSPSSSASTNPSGQTTQVGCQRVASAAGAGGAYIKVSLVKNEFSTSDYVLTNTLDCTFELSVTARFMCTGGTLPVSATAAIVISPKQVLPITVNSYFSQANFECQNKLNKNNAYAYPVNENLGLGQTSVSVRIVSSR